MIYSVIIKVSRLNYTDALPLLSATLGVGSGMIVEQVRCNGAERRLTDCTIRDSNDGECSHNEDAGVRCCELHMNHFAAILKYIAIKRNLALL